MPRTGGAPGRTAAILNNAEVAVNTVGESRGAFEENDAPGIKTGAGYGSAAGANRQPVLARHRDAELGRKSLMERDEVVA